MKTATAILGSDNEVQTARTWRSGLASLACWILAVAFVFQALELNELLRFDRERVESGALWLLITGQFVHLGWAHWGMNIAGLLLIVLLFGNPIDGQPPTSGRTELRSLAWMLALLGSALGAGIGVLLFDPDTARVSGLSGLLHGLFAYGALQEARTDRVAGGALLILLLSKILFEQIQGPLSGSAGMIGAVVCVDAHFFGALGGTLTGLSWHILARQARPEMH